MSRGNTDTDSANAKIDLADLIGDGKHSLHLEGLYGRSNEITAAERWAVLLQSDLKITPRAFGFVALHFLQDEFSGFQYQASATTGVGTNSSTPMPINSQRRSAPAIAACVRNC
jgi:putative salt-induced outer membrane protein